jgi:hypothetical protein
MLRAREEFRDGNYWRPPISLAAGRRSRSVRLDALVLVARCHSELGDAAAARTVWGAVLDLDPQWRPDPRKIPQEQIRAFESVRAGRPQPVARKSWYARKSVMLGALGVLAGGVALAAMSGSSQNEPIHPIGTPPPPPGK